MKSEFSTPAVKSFIVNLFERKEGLVWIQGDVVDVNLKSNFISISDGTGNVRVVNVTCNPSGTNWIQKGIYCMVVGEIIEISKQIRAIKLTDLSSFPLHKEIWAKEVIHQENHRRLNN